MEFLRDKKIVVVSVARGAYTNYGNRLIEQSTFRLLGLPPDTPALSAFQPFSDETVPFIEQHDLLVVTGCTTLQDAGGHQACFDDRFRRLRVRKVCFGASFYCEPDDAPSLRVARMYDAPIGARDPWTAEYLSANGVACHFIGCPTLLDGNDLDGWNEQGRGPVFVSSTPVLEEGVLRDIPGDDVHYLAHEPSSRGEELKDASVFDGAALVITGRLHAALPAIARGVPVRYYGKEHWIPEYRRYEWGAVRYTLLDHLGVHPDGRPSAYPRARIRELRENFARWLKQSVS